MAGDDRGWRMDAYAPRPLQRVGSSATVRNPDELLAWFAPAGERRVVGTSAVSTLPT